LVIYRNALLAHERQIAEERARTIEREEQRRRYEAAEAQRRRELAEKEARAREEWVAMHRHIEFQQLDNLSGLEFEQVLERMFRQLGFTVMRTKGSGDQGADLLVEHQGKRVAVQAKRYRGRVGNSAVQELLGAIAYYSCHGGIVVATTGFTKSAKELAQKATTVELWPRERLREAYCQAFPPQAPEFSWEKYHELKASHHRAWYSPC
jgi:restriction endonuclease Mrr